MFMETGNPQLAVGSPKTYCGGVSIIVQFRQERVPDGSKMEMNNKPALMKRILGNEILRRFFKN